ncbi:MAG: O-antigen ligase family protein [Candidatus Omnitrophica bacterium]|nr:O-antigen ligase family protein [Candidatus Omnitrophota bacterium]
MKERWVSFFDHVVEYSLYAMIFFIPISKAGIEILFSFAIFAFCAKKFLKPDFKSFLRPINFFLFFFIAFNALSLFNSGPYFKKSLISLIFKWGEYFLIFFLIQDTFSSYRRIRNALFILLSFSLVVGIDGLSQYFRNVEFLRHKSLVVVSNGIPAITAAFNHYNDLGAYLLVMLSLALALFISKHEWPDRLVLIPLLVLSEACLLLTFSRGAWIGFIFLLLLMVFLSRKFKELIIFSTIFIILLIAMPNTRERLAFIFKISGDADRFIVWRSALSMIKENPFLGKGIGTFMDWFSKRVPNLYTQYAHNCFLQIWAEAGIFSLLSFLAFVSVLLSKGIATFKKTNNYMLLGIVCGIFGFLVHSFFDTHFYSLQLSALFWSIAGILAASINLETDVNN